MEIWEVVLIGVALSMDAFAVGMSDGMTEPGMPRGKAFLVAATFGGFQFFMPMLGYYGSSLISSLIQRIAPWLSFFLLAFLGAKMIADCLFGADEKRAVQKKETLQNSKLLLQGIATSLDALAVGVTFLALETSNGLPMSALGCSAIVGFLTFFLSLAAVFLGKKLGARFSGNAGAFGGAVLLLIGLKILLEGIM